MACFSSVLNAARTSVLKANVSIVNCLPGASKLAASLCALTLFWQQMEDIFVYIVFFLVAVGGGSDKSKQIGLKQTNKQTNKQTRQNPKEKEIQSKLELHSSQMSLPLSQWSSGIGADYPFDKCSVNKNVSLEPQARQNTLCMAFGQKGEMFCCRLLMGSVNT